MNADLEGLATSEETRRYIAPMLTLFVVERQHCMSLVRSFACKQQCPKFAARHVFYKCLVTRSHEQWYCGYEGGCEMNIRASTLMNGFKLG